MTTLFLMCGLPGAAKSTVAKRLAPQVPAVRLCPDEWMTELGIELHHLGVPLEQLEKRLANRSGSVTITRDLLENYAMLFQAPTIEELALFDPPREV